MLTVIAQHLLGVLTEQEVASRGSSSYSTKGFHEGRTAAGKQTAVAARSSPYMIILFGPVYLPPDPWSQGSARECGKNLGEKGRGEGCSLGTHQGREAGGPSNLMIRGKNRKDLP